MKNVVTPTSKTNYLQLRLEPELKNQTQKVLNKLGITANQAIKMYFSQIVLKQAIPFPITLSPLEVLDEETEKRVSQAQDEIKI